MPACGRTQTADGVTFVRGITTDRSLIGVQSRVITQIDPNGAHTVMTPSAVGGIGVRIVELVNISDVAVDMNVTAYLMP